VGKQFGHPLPLTGDGRLPHSQDGCPCSSLGSLHVLLVPDEMEPKSVVCAFERPGSQRQPQANDNGVSDGIVPLRSGNRVFPIRAPLQVSRTQRVHTSS
jgi:hypothetical protein